MKTNKIHFVGIKGVGMAPLAIIVKEAGFDVSGCDIDEEFITDASLQKAGIKPLTGFDASHIKDCSLVVTTGAHGGFDNPEVIKAKELGIKVWTQGEAVGKIMGKELLDKKYEGISVSGSHGKTTTTAMIATILKANGLDPTFLVGTGNVESLGSCGHFGKGKYFVSEADEYATEPKYDKTPKFLWQKPKIAVITNIEYDHPDIYPTLESLDKAFLEFSKTVEKDGVLITYFEDTQIPKILKDYRGKSITYGFSKQADFHIEKLSIEQDEMFFWVYAKETLLGQFALNVIGEHNALNALGSIIVCLELGLTVENIKKGLMGFKGTKRRFEFLGNLPSGASLYDDYAHHPTEIRKTLSAIKKSFPNKKIVCIFQPHTYSRTKNLFEQFVSSFSAADIVIIADIYPSLRESIDGSVSSRMLANRISTIHKDVFYIPSLPDVVKYVVLENFGKEFLIVIMGAGDIYKIAKDLLKK